MISGIKAPWVFGLSPRGRGNHPVFHLSLSPSGSIPAWAGEPMTWTSWHLGPEVYPRVGGGTISQHRLGNHLGGLSPRGRGNRLHYTGSAGHSGSIPAWAGEPWYGTPKATKKTVYPRVGGGTRSVADSGIGFGGLSPRGRGNPDSSNHNLPVRRSIPAWAGEPC